MKIKVAKHAGYCYGVERALKLTNEASKSSVKPIYTLGPIIHNPQVVEALKEQGVYPVKSLNEVGKGTVIISSHGAGPEVAKKARSKKIRVVDATCPFVKKAQASAAQLIKDGYSLVIVGERNHPEVVGILAHAHNKALVVEKISDLKALTQAGRVGVVVQTTQSVDNLVKAVSALIPKVSELKVFNTICGATTKRQEAARQLAKKVDVMVVVGGKISANTTRLAQICRASDTLTYHIETAKELRPKWFKKTAVVGVTAGASTPDWILDQVVSKLSTIAT